MKTLENLREHSRPLTPLKSGDHVLIQNQSGRFPNKWDKSGTIIEARGNDQYAVKVAGSGRLTLRNRRFLRRYEPHNTTNLPIAAPTAATLPSPAALFEVPDKKPEHDSNHLPVNMAEELTGIERRSTAPAVGNGLSGPHVSFLPVMQQQSLALPANRGPASEPSDNGSCGPHVSPLPEMQRQPSAPPASGLPSGSRAQLPSTVATGQHQTRRSTRERKLRQVYDATTGKYVAPCAVADEYQ